MLLICCYSSSSELSLTVQNLLPWNYRLLFKIFLLMNCHCSEFFSSSGLSVIDFSKFSYFSGLLLTECSKSSSLQSYCVLFKVFLLFGIIPVQSHLLFRVIAYSSKSFFSSELLLTIQSLPQLQNCHLLFIFSCILLCESTVVRW